MHVAHKPMKCYTEDARAHGVRESEFDSQRHDAAPTTYDKLQKPLNRIFSNHSNYDS